MGGVGHAAMNGAWRQANPAAARAFIGGSAAMVSSVTFIRGFGVGLVSGPMKPTGFATLSPQLRTGGTEPFNPKRNIGGAVLATLILMGSLQTPHNQPFVDASFLHRALNMDGESVMMNPQMPFGLANLNSLIECRPQVQAYANVFPFMFLVSLPVFVVIWLMKRPVFAAGATPKLKW